MKKGDILVVKGYQNGILRFSRKQGKIFLCNLYDYKGKFRKEFVGLTLNQIESVIPFNETDLFSFLGWKIQSEKEIKREASEI